MASPEEILSGLTEIANAWKGLAIFWHGYIAITLLPLIAGARPTRKTFAALLAWPVFSVGVLAGLHGNPFNAVAFVVMAVVLLIMAVRLPARPVLLAGPLTAAAGMFMIGFGWVYPHFTNVSVPTAYLYASPLGLVPCPTISVAIGATLLLSGFASKPWCLALGGFGAFYGSFGVFRLGVELDWPLLLGAIVLAMYAFTASARPGE